MIAGIPPFRGETPSDCIASILTTEPPPLSGVLPDVSLKLESILQKALRKNSDERYQTIKEMLADLRLIKGKAESSLPQTKARAEPIVSEIKRHKRRVLLTLAAAVLVAAAGAYSFFFFAASPLPNEKKIAVVPFEKLREEKSNAHCVHGNQG